MLSSGSLSLARATVFCVAVLLGLSVTTIGFLVGFVGGLPNQLAAPFLDQWPLLKTLWASNPGAAAPILMQQPLMVIAHSESAGGRAVWKLFFFPVPVAIQLTVSSLAAAILLRSSARGAMLRRLISLLPAMAVLLFVTTYIQVSSCCTSGPRWAFDVWLFSAAYNSPGTLIDWQQLYFRIGGVLPMGQVALALLGAGLLIEKFVKYKSSPQSTQSAQRNSS